MVKNVNETLQAVNNNLLEESRLSKQKLQNNLLRIKELDVFLNSVEEDKESDFHLFSPRKQETFDKNFLDIKKNECLKEKEELEAENNHLHKDISKLDSRIADLQAVISANPFLNRYIFLDMQEKERQRIAGDLHDSSLQNLTHLIHVIELSSLFIDQDPARAKLELATLVKKLRMIIEDIRNTIYDLRPMEFDDLGFKDAIQNMVEKLQKETNIYIKLIMEADIPIRNGLIFSNIYRIIKECVTNAIKHSEASEVMVTVFEKEDICHTEIRDNGIGFELNKERKRHFGLQILEERIQLLKGTLEIYSSEIEATGTIIKIGIPITGNEF